MCTYDYNNAMTIIKERAALVVFFGVTRAASFIYMARASAGQKVTRRSEIPTRNHHAPNTGSACRPESNPLRSVGSPGPHPPT